MLAKLRSSLQVKVLAAVLVATFAALLVSTVALLLYEVDNYRDFLRGDLRTQADIFARMTAPALAFDDPEGASADLALLESRPGFEAAAIYEPNGQVLATYVRGGRSEAWPEVEALETLRVEDGSLVVFRPVIESGNLLGTIYLRARYDLGARARAYLLLLVTVMSLALMVAGLISLAVVGSVIRPLKSVTRVALRVIEERDFSYRAKRASDDEIGVLVDAFNAMLHEVGSRTTELEEANRTLQIVSETRRRAEAKLREADRRKDEFLATLAHELRNPMAPMLNAIELLRLAEADTGDSRRGLKILDRQLRQLIRLIDDLLDVSRISSGKLNIRKEIVSVGEIVNSAVETIEPQLNARSHTLDINLPRQSVHVLADPARLAQVISNLLNNAMKYSDPGTPIVLSVREESEFVRMEVTDSGRGLAADELDTVFEMFAQGGSAGAQGQTGLGVGLALARQLIVLHGGTIEASSDGPGCGATFVVNVPRATAPQAKPALDAPGETPAEQPTRVLIVDDNIDFASTLALLFGAVGYEVRVANSGQEALEIAGRFRPEIGILDIGLPDIGGRELAGRLRRMARDRQLILIAISGWGQDEDRKQSLAAGFARHLVKPVDFRTIQDALRDIREEVEA